ncbi:MAG TPA: zinc ribbon domain-containing protein [Candidatus Cloacimonadota bacterium]|nr:zinc ribbon domain-containing protein [Candidatus Cloacimonadota bacterium]
MLTKCKECGHEISTDAKVCPNCGKQIIKSSSCMIVLLSALILIMLILIIGFCSNVSKPPRSNISPNTPSQDAMIEKLISQGNATVDAGANSVYLDSFIWEGSDAVVKQNLTAAFGKYINQKNGGLFVEIYDKQSGKKLARWGSSSGYKQYYP